MNKKNTTRQTQRLRRRIRVRARIQGSASVPRFNVFRGLRGMFLQLIDDVNGKTLVSVHSKKEAVSGDAGDRSGKVATAYLLGQALAKKAKTVGIERIVFDRGGYAYHGRVKAAADGARDGGLVF
jgi:large subunit ribosomal protein L18